MMTDDSPRDERVDRIVAEYVERLIAGESLDREAILSEHPDLAAQIIGEIETFLDLGPAAEDETELGTLGDFRLLRQIGRGGMGIVYEAWQTSMDRRVALKVLPVGLAADVRTCARFMREAQAAGRIHHPNVVAVHAMGVDENTPYYAMEFVEGETLANVLARLRAAEGDPAEERRVASGVSRLFGRVQEGTAADEPPAKDLAAGAAPLRQAEMPFGAGGVDSRYYLNLATAFAGVAEGLQHAHRSGVIHRDVKPSNLILDRQARLRILDFGVAHLEGQESLTLLGDIVGTPLYMSPEQVQARKISIDHRTDIYSLGATMYEMLTWHPPFEGKSHQDTLSQILIREPRSLRNRNPRIPRDLESIVLKCLNKSPNDRYNTAEALAQDLRRFARSEPIEARPRSRWEILLRRIERHRWRVVASACVALLLAVTSILAYGLHAEKERKERAVHRKALVSAALSLERAALLGSQAAGEFHLLDPAIPSTMKYEFEGLFSAAGGVPLEDVVSSLDRTITRFPDWPEARYYKAKALRLLNRWPEAREELNLALGADPDFAPVRFLIEEMERPAEGAEPASPSAEEDGRYDPESWQGLWLSAQRALKEWRWDDAVLAFDRLHRMSASGEEVYAGAAVESWLGRGRALLGAREFKAAARAFAVAAEYLWPEAMEPALLLAKAYFLAGDREEADRIFQALDERMLASGGAAILIGGIYLSLEDPERSLYWTERIKDEGLRACARSAIHLWREDARQAEAEARKAVEAAPGSAWAHTSMGEVLEAMHRYSEAEEEYRRSIGIDAGSVPAHVGLGRALCFQEEWEEGERHLRQAIELDPDHLPAYYESMRALAHKEDFAQAEEILLRALRRNRMIAHTHTALGFVYMKQGLHEKAIATHKQAIALNPASSSAHYHLGLVYVDRHEPGEAIRHFTRALALHPSLGYCMRDLLILLGGEDRLACREGLGELIDMLERQLSGSVSHPLWPSAIEAVILARLHRGEEGDLDRALEHVERKIALNPMWKDPDTIALLARTLFGQGRLAEAFRVLEDACGLPRYTRSSRASRSLERRLERYRAALLPALPTFGSVDQALASLDTVDLIPHGAEWRFFRGTREPSDPLAWTAVAFEDSSWEKGKSPFGFADPDVATPLTDMPGRYASLYARAEFTVDDPGRFERIALTVLADDGCVAFLNGKEVARIRTERDRPWIPADGTATWWVEEPMAPEVIVLSPESLRAGRNVLAIQGLNRSRHHTRFFLAPAIEARVPADPSRDTQLLAAFRAVAKDEDAARLAYIEARILQRAGRFAEAADRFREAARLDAGPPEPYLRLAETLHASGDAEAAEGVLRSALRDGPARGCEIWHRWIVLALKDPGRNPEEILAAFPCPPGGAPPCGEDIRWLLGRLARGDAIRISCGALPPGKASPPGLDREEYTASDGTTWTYDRFFRAGIWFGSSLSDRDRAGVPDHPLYGTNRYQNQPSGGPTYRIPLPPGPYRVTLLFLEVVHGRLIGGTRRFDVLIEGRRILREYEAPRGRVDAQSFETRVDDGSLDVELVQGSASFPFLSALRIERTD